MPPESPSTAMAVPQAAAVDDLELLLGRWLADQRDRLDTGVGELGRLQQQLFKTWLDLLDALGQPLQAALAEGWARDVTVPGWPAMGAVQSGALQQLLAAWWSPWTPFLLRGTEQLA